MKLTGISGDAPLQRLLIQIEAIFHLALGPQTIPLEPAHNIVENSVPQDCLYAEIGMRLDPSFSEIRLLELISYDNTAVKCRMIRVNLDERPIYDALSYVWGTPNPPSPATPKRI